MVTTDKKTSQLSRLQQLYFLGLHDSGIIKRFHKWGLFVLWLDDISRTAYNGSHKGDTNMEQEIKPKHRIDDILALIDECLKDEVIVVQNEPSEDYDERVLTK